MPKTSKIKIGRFITKFYSEYINAEKI